MPYQIKRDELWELFFEEKKQIHHTHIKSNIAQGEAKEIQISPEISMYIIDMKIHRDLKVIGDFEEEFLTFSSIYDGNVYYEDTIIDEKFNFKKGYSNISYSKHEKGIEYYREKQSFKYVTLFCTKDFISKNEYLKKFNYDHFRFNCINPYAHLITQEIFNNPYTGELERFFLQNKAMDLIFYGLNEFKNKEYNTKLNFLNEEDILRIQRAKDIILNEYQNPPSILELAKRTAINEFKLKKGFKLIYKNTIYGYLNDFRMKKAYDLLEKNIYSIKEISSMMGYKCQSSFTVAFIKKFGVRPKEITKIKRYYYL